MSSTDIFNGGLYEISLHEGNRPGRGALCQHIPCRPDSQRPRRPRRNCSTTSEHYILDAQYDERWAAEDKDLDQKLAELRQKFGAPPNIIHILFDDTPVGEVGIPFIQKQRGWETPNINRLADEGINFTQDVHRAILHTQSCGGDDRPAWRAQRHVQRWLPYESGGLAASEVTIADVLGKAGYATAFYGKWHLGDIEASYATRHGFDEALWMP